MGLHVYICESQGSTLDVIILGAGPPFFCRGEEYLRILVPFSPALGLQADTASTPDVFIWVLENWTWVLMPTGQALYHLSYPPQPL